MYASLGLTDFEFALLAVIITAVAILYGQRKLQLLSDIKFWKQRDDEREKE
jgi:Flp pilus assembly pilin Flp